MDDCILTSILLPYPRFGCHFAEIRMEVLAFSELWNGIPRGYFDSFGGEYSLTSDRGYKSK